MTIWKYSLKVGRNSIAMPDGAKILRCGVQSGEVVIWALLDPAKDRQERQFDVVGTGWVLHGDMGDYIDTVQVGPLVWHIFETSQE